MFVMFLFVHCLQFQFVFCVGQMVKGGVSETRIEKRIVISGDSDIDHDEVCQMLIYSLLPSLSLCSSCKFRYRLWAPTVKEHKMLVTLVAPSGFPFISKWCDVNKYWYWLTIQRPCSLPAFPIFYLPLVILPGTALPYIGSGSGHKGS